MRIDLRACGLFGHRSLLLALLASSAAAQADFVNTTSGIPQGNPFNNSFTENVDFADVDADGDFDAIWADGGDSGNDQSRIWINQGGAQGGTLGVFNDATSTRLPSVQADSRDLDFVDVDADGDYDIYQSNTSLGSNQTNRWWINQGGLQGGGAGFFADETASRWVSLGVNDGSTTFSSIAPPLVLGSGGFIDWSCDGSFADLDDDGDMDLVHTSYGNGFAGGGPSRIFLNRGGAQGGSAGFFEEFNPSHSQLATSDIATGSPGLWCQGAQQHNTLDTSGAQCDIADSPLGVELGDLDGDLDVDFVQGALGQVPRYFANRLAETSTLGFRDVTAARFPAGYATFGGGAYEQELGDMDSDGDLDLYGTGWLSLCDRYFKNNGAGTFGAASEVPNSCNDDNEIDWFDADGDGDLDIFVSGFGGADTLFRNTGVAGGFTLLEAAGEMGSLSGGSLGADCCDVDEDGDYDVFAAKDGGNANRFYQNLTQIADTTPPRLARLEQAPNRSPSSTPTAIRVQLYDNSSWNIAQFDVVTLEYQVDGGGFTGTPMRYGGGQIFRGEIPGALAGTIEYRVSATDEHGNGASTRTKTYTSGGCAAVATYCTAKVNSSGCMPYASSTGSPSASAGSGFFVEAQQVLAGKAGLVFYSTLGPGGTPFQGGFLCATPPTKRTPLQTSSASGSPPCTGRYSFDFNVRIASGIDPTLVVGQQVWSQYWTRDGGSPSGTGLANGLTFTICP